MDAETLEPVFKPSFTTKGAGEGSRFCVYLPLCKQQSLH